jgi:hypothetical protein
MPDDTKQRGNAAHIIRKVLLRQIAITNYVNPFYWGIMRRCWAKAEP